MRTLLVFDSDLYGGAASKLSDCDVVVVGVVVTVALSSLPTGHYNHFAALLGRVSDGRFEV